MSLPVIVIGGGGHAKVLIDVLRLNGVEIIGIVESDPDLFDKQVLGVYIVGGDNVVEGYKPGDVELVNGLGSVCLPSKRKALFEEFKKQGFVFAKVVHPSAIVASDVFIEEGVQVMAGAVIQPGTEIGCNCIINTKASVDHDCIIGDHVHLAPGVTLSGNVRVDEGSHIGIGAGVIQDIKIGKNVVVGAGSLVLENILDESVVVGVPAKVMKK